MPDPVLRMPPIEVAPARARQAVDRAKVPAAGVASEAAPRHRERAVPVSARTVRPARSRRAGADRELWGAPPPKMVAELDAWAPAR